MKRRLILGVVVFLVIAFIGLTVYLIINRQTIFSRASGNPPSCPSGTQLLFVSSTNIKVGNTVALNGKIDVATGNPTMETQNGVPMVRYAQILKVTFPNNILLDSALIYDNDPKNGEKPWSINGISLPVTGGGNWGPLFRLNQTTNVMNFDHGGDSSHINVCVKTTTSATPTHTPTRTRTPTPPVSPSPTKTPTSTPTATPTQGITPSITPTPSACPLPEAVTDVKVNCPICTQ